MEQAIKDNYNKETTCEYCGSMFSYNEKDLKWLYYTEQCWGTENKRFKNIKFDEHVAVIKGQYVVCPFCSSAHLVISPRTYITRDTLDKDEIWSKFAPTSVLKRLN